MLDVAGDVKVEVMFDVADDVEVETELEAVEQSRDPKAMLPVLVTCLQATASHL